MANYTAGKSLDTNSDATGGGSNPDPWNHRTNRGPSDFDIAQRLVISGIWEMPRLQRSPVLIRWVLGGWQSNAIYTAETGIPLTVRSGADNNYDGVSGDFGDYLGGEWRLSKDRPRQEQIARWFNTSVFARNTVGTVGAARRGQLRAPGDSSLDYSLFKNFQLVEHTRLQFRGEFFNVFNHASLGAPNTSVNSPNFGTISSALEARIVQFALKLIF